MFEILQSTHPRAGKKAATDLVLSVGIHSAIIYAAWNYTPAIVETAARALDQRDLIFLAQPRPALEPARAADAPRARVVPTDVVVSVNPPPKGFQTISAPTVIPSSIPPVDLNEKAIDVRNFTGRGVEGGVANGVVGGTGRVTDADLAGIGGADVVYTELQLDEVAQVLSQPPLFYPPALESAGVMGVVVLQFVIDTTGRVEPKTIHVLASPHDLFTQAARTVILGSKFKPARFHGQKVRQLAEQKLRFVVQQS